MPRKMKEALSASLVAEDTAFKTRFEKAEAVLGSQASGDRQSSASEATLPEVPPASQVIRDTFTFPEEDYALIFQIQERCLHSAKMVNKSEILRAGLHALTNLSENELKDVIGRLTKIKTGRPSRKNK